MTEPRLAPDASAELPIGRLDSATPESAAPLAAERPGAGTELAVVAQSQTNVIPEASLRPVVRMIGKLPVDAARRFKMVHGRMPDTLDEVAPYAFTWPAITGPTGMRPIPVWPTADLGWEDGALPLQTLLSDPQWLRFHVAVSHDSLQLHYPFFDPALDSVQPRLWERPVLTREEMHSDGNPNLAARMPVPDPIREPLSEADAARAFQAMLLYRTRAADPSDARVGEAANQLINILTHFASTHRRVPISWDEAAQSVQVCPINLVVLHQSEAAAVQIDAVGTDALRLRVRYPSGHREDTVMHFTEEASRLVTRMKPYPASGWHDADARLLLSVEVNPVESAAIPAHVLSGPQ